ncbi:unnamed protein product [Rotaria sp. Silwood2]|nr:unnamed protein product [Rotaria sp. Silwood2]CAF2956760.1 unnamed protein product [Rotaria sp. Silwood2]CAF3295604.1 unnamed protein product [Rotaria sp. Silwood2]CAF3308342.1 unnamed protein product [Rotaria sp. Silwood2]CAF4058392.1 unnamed protein product [Rotaria sp. Silwood2]
MSSSSTAQLIVTIAEYYTIYTGFITLFFGIIGNISLIFVLTRLRIFRGNPSAFYLITESITNSLQMAILLTSRIAMNGFATDLTQTILFWCRLRASFRAYFTLKPLSIICFSAIDQYLSTSYYPFLRQKSTMNLTKILITIVTIVWILHGIPFFLFSGIQTTYGCFIYNSSFLNYIIYFYYPILSGILPIIISTFFGVLAYRNVRRIVRRQMPIRRRKFDQQLTAMILIRVVFLVIMISPYVLERIYAVVFKTKHGILYDAILILIDDVAYSFFHINYAGSFYLFLISSKRFRRQVKHAFIQKFWEIFCTKRIHQNQIVPITQSCISEDDF